MLLLLVQVLVLTANLYGLTRVQCPPGVPHAPSGCAQLVGVNFQHGRLTRIGRGHNPLAAVGDLRAVVRGVYYVLADNCGAPCSEVGTVLLGLSLKDGSEVCRSELPSLAEVGLVGGGQSLSHDAKNGRLLLTGLNSTDGGATYTHLLLSATLDHTGRCGSFTKLGEFGDAEYEPMAHGSELDVSGQRLFITLSTGPHSYGMGVLDVQRHHAVKLTATYPMRSGDKAMWGPSFVNSSGRLVGAGVDASGRGIDWRTLDPASGTWTSEPIKYAPGVNVTFPGLEGNLGSVRAFDAEAGVLYLLAGRRDPRNPILELIAVDVATGTLIAHSGPLSGDTGVSGSILMQIALDPSSSS